MIKNVHIVQPHAAQRLIERGQQVFARTPIAVRPRPHVVTRLRGNDQFIAIRRKIDLEQPAKSFFRRAIRRSVVIGQIEMRDAEIERAPHDGASVFKRVGAAEIMPQAEGNQRQLESRPSATAVE
jgi:hypothetical protein